VNEDALQQLYEPFRRKSFWTTLVVSSVMMKDQDRQAKGKRKCYDKIAEDGWHLEVFQCQGDLFPADKLQEDLVKRKIDDS
jgi:hypothetical protein